MFSDEACTTTVALPATVADGANTTFYFASPGAYTLSVKTSSGVQIAGDLGATRTISVTTGEVAVLTYDTRIVARDASGDSGRNAVNAALAGTYPSFSTRRRGLLLPNPSNARLFGLPTVMGSPPTVTLGVANAGTGIASGVRHDGTDPGITFIGAAYVDPGSVGGFFNCKQAGYLTTSSPSQRLRFVYECDGQYSEIAFQNNAGASSQYRVWVDGQLVTSAPQAAGASGGAIYRVLINHAARGNHRVIFEGGYTTFVGVWTEPTATLWPSTQYVGPTAVWIGDSFSEGTGANWWWDSWAMKAGQWLGWNICPSAVGATGYLANGGGGGKVTYRSRLTADVVNAYPNADIVVVSGGYNDTGSFTAAQEQTEAALLFAAIKSGLPNATLVVCLPNWPHGVVATGTETQFRDGILAAATGIADYVVDPLLYPSGTSWITGTGRVGATTGNGNADFFTGTDNTHPSQAGHDYMGRRFAQTMLSLSS